VTPQQIHLVQDSFERLWPSTNKMTRAFYDRLFVLAPETRRLFSPDLSHQKMKLIGMIASAIGSLERPEMFDSIITSLGRNHVDYGVLPAHYEPVGEALMWSLEQTLGADFTDETRAAWVALYARIRNTMLGAALQ
jgi:hemoglobin-like flavoprotein